MFAKAIFERTTSDGKSTLPELDALRGIAVLAVFAQHFADHVRPLIAERVSAAPALFAPWIASTVGHAHWGVDLFFVVSGFTLALGWLRADRGGRPQMRAASFWRRRAARILPAFYAAVVLTLLVRADLVHSPGLPSALAAHAFLLQGYVAAGGIVIIGATWSLSTEASFYLLFPWLAPQVLGRGRRALVVAGALVLFAWTLRAVFYETDRVDAPFRGFFELSQRRWIVSRLDQFVLGMIAARIWIAQRDRGWMRRHGRHVALGAAAALVASFRLDSIAFGTTFGAVPYVATSLATFAVVIGVTSADRAGAGVAIVARGLGALGTVSYGIFLFHQLVIDEVMRRLPDGGSIAVAAVLSLGISVVAGLVSWIVVERPALSLGRGAGRTIPEVGSA